MISVELMQIAGFKFFSVINLTIDPQIGRFNYPEKKNLKNTWLCFEPVRKTNYSKTQQS